MPSLIANDVRLEYEISGPKNGPVILMITGLADQLTYWPVELIDRLNAQGFRTLRFDNRDIGKSEKLHDKRAVRPLYYAIGGPLGLANLAPYSLVTMARDTISLLNELGIDKAHVLGMSMGGMIGQILTAKNNSRVLSFTSLLSTTNHASLPKPPAELLKKMLASKQQTKASREEVIADIVTTRKMIGTKTGGYSEKALRQIAEEYFERSYYPAGVSRQVAAILRTGSTRKWAQKITRPTLIIQGGADPMTPIEAGEDIARYIKHSKLEVIAGLGHDLPKKYMPRISKLIIEHIKTAQEDGFSGEVEAA